MYTIRVIPETRAIMITYNRTEEYIMIYGSDGTNNYEDFLTLYKMYKDEQKLWSPIILFNILNRLGIKSDRIRPRFQGLESDYSIHCSD